MSRRTRWGQSEAARSPSARILAVASCSMRGRPLALKRMQTARLDAPERRRISVATALSTGTANNWAEVTIVSFHGQGRVLPRLSVSLKVSKLPVDARVRLLSLSGLLKLDVELLAVAIPTTVHADLNSRGTTTTLDFPLSPEAIAAIQSRASDPAIILAVELVGLHNIYLEPDAQSRFAPPFPPGEWTPVSIQPTVVTLSIPRSDWYSRVLEPIGAYRYLLWAVAVPKAQEAGTVAAAVRHVAAAEKAIATGDDAAVFFHCRGAWDALPGDKVAIFDVILDTKKRARVDELGKRFGGFLHAGRHVAADGSQEGEFPVDHRDAEFALNMTKLFVGYISRLWA